MNNENRTRESHDWRKARQTIFDLMENGDGFCHACMKTFGKSSSLKNSDRENTKHVEDMRDMFVLLSGYFGRHISGNGNFPERLRAFYPESGSADWEHRIPVIKLWEAYRQYKSNRTKDSLFDEDRVNEEVLSSDDIVLALRSGITPCNKRHHLYNMLIAKGFNEKEAALFAKSIKCNY